jgi:Rrf2 family protein
MDVLRRNTDYALRMMVDLAKRYNGEFISARQLAEDGNFSHQLGCKILQKLHKTGLVKSDMGPKGGFVLSRTPSRISLMEIIKVMQGGIRLNRCLRDGKGCDLEPACEINTKLHSLQLYIDGYLGAITLQEILGSKSKITVRSR